MKSSYRWARLSRRVVLGLALVAPAAVMTTARADEPLKLVFTQPTTAAPVHLPFFIAQDLGWYQKAGLTVEEKVVTGDVNCMRSVIAGDALVTDIGPNIIMQAFATGAKVKIVGALQPLIDYQVVARADAGDLKSLADKRWAIASAGGMVQVLPKLMMTRQGLPITDMKFVVVGGYAARYQALLAGTADATLLDTMLATRGVAAGKIKAVTAVGQVLPNFGFDYLVARASSLQTPEERKALAIFVRGGIEGARFIADHPHEAAEIMEKRLKENDVASMELVLKEMSRLNVWGVNGGLEQPAYDFAAKTYRDNGDVTQDVTYQQLVDTSLVDPVVQELGKR